MNFKKVVKKLLINPSVRRFFSKTVFFLFKKKVLAEWPAWAGKFAGISIPSGTLINETPQVSGGSNVNIIFKLLKQTFQLEGDVVECGVFQGHTLIPIGLFLKENGFNKKVYGMEKDHRFKNYYVNESVGIASGFLLAAIHQVGLVALTHTPSPMSFLSKILKRPENERAFLLIPVGYPAEDAHVPAITRKKMEEVVEIV